MDLSSLGFSALRLEEREPVRVESRRGGGEGAVLGLAGSEWETMRLNGAIIWDIGSIV